MPLVGSWYVVCQSLHVDRVDGITVNHDCETCGRKSVADGAANVKCPFCGDVDLVGGVTAGHKCSVCGKEVRIQ